MPTVLIRVHENGDDEATVVTTFPKDRAVEFLTQSAIAVMMELAKLKGADLLMGLTPRERQIAEKMGAGVSHKAIARELGLSPRTIEIHWHHAKRKLHVRRAIDLAYLRLAHDLLLSRDDGGDDEPKCDN